MAEFFNVLSLEEAQSTLKENWPGLREEEVALHEAEGRVLAQDVFSTEDLPPFNRSTVDGYAVLASDVHGASEGIPAFLSLAGEVAMGVPAEVKVQPGECAWVPTGGMIPPGADAVVMVEYTEKLGSDTVLVTRPVAAGENVMKTGEDCRQGELVIPGGRLLRAQDIGVLAALGWTRVKVASRLRTGVISTGDEIVGVDQTPRYGQVRDVNTHVLSAALRSWGSEVKAYGIVPDDCERLRESICRALTGNDIVFLSGGSSVGTRDLTLEVLLSFPGAKMLFHGLSVKPGKPTLAVKIDGQLVIGLPGHPVSALMVLTVLIGDVISTRTRSRVTAVLADSVASQAGRDDFVRVRLLANGEERPLAKPVHGKAGLIKVMSEAQGFIHIPRRLQGLNRGDPVTVHLF